MTPIEFKHDGRTYEVRPLTEFQKSLSITWMMDVCLEVTGKEWSDAPLSTRRLISFFINLNLATKIDGEAFNPLTSANKDGYLVFANNIIMDTSLQTLWNDAYDEANLEKTDPNSVSVEPPAES